MNTEIHIGKQIQDILKEEGRSTSWFARKMHCTPSSIHKICHKPHIHSELLLRISLILDYDFFTYYSDFITKNRNRSHS
jgi:plasmid maintenance system antidote protein VapI